MALLILNLHSLPVLLLINHPGIELTIICNMLIWYCNLLLYLYYMPSLKIFSRWKILVLDTDIIYGVFLGPEILAMVASFLWFLQEEVVLAAQRMQVLPVQFMTMSLAALLSAITTNQRIQTHFLWNFLSYFWQISIFIIRQRLLLPCCGVVSRSEDKIFVPANTLAKCVMYGIYIFTMVNFAWNIFLSFLHKLEFGYPLGLIFKFLNAFGWICLKFFVSCPAHRGTSCFLLPFVMVDVIVFCFSFWYASLLLTTYPFSRDTSLSRNIKHLFFIWFS